MVHYALGDRLVRALTLASRPFFDNPPAGFTDVPLGQPDAGAGSRARGGASTRSMRWKRRSRQFATIERLDARGVHELCPLLKDDAVHGIADRNGIRLDPHALLQGNLRQLSSSGGALSTGAARRCHRTAGWHVDAHDREGRGLFGPDHGQRRRRLGRPCRAPGRCAAAGLEPKRRTIITFDAPPGTTLDALPFAKTVGDELYFAPESGRLFASPMDEVPSEPCDAQADEFEVALAAYRMEERTIVKVEQIHSRWAGLRTFTPDKHPAVGFAPDAEGFFWLAGQGGFGLQTSPAMAADRGFADQRWGMAAARRKPGGAKSRPLRPAGGIGRPSVPRRARTVARSAPRPMC